MPRKKGSSPLLTAERMQSIVDHFHIGLSVKDCAEMNDIDESTFYLWLQKAQDGTEPYASFRRAVTRARATGVANLHKRVLTGGKGSSQAMFILERRFPDRYGSRQRLEHSGPDGGAIRVEAKAITQMSEEELLRLASGESG